MPRRRASGPAVSTTTMPVSTANGVVTAARVKIDRIEIDGIEVEDVDGMVLPEGPSGSLLGMSFLSRLDSFEVRTAFSIFGTSRF